MINYTETNGVCMSERRTWIISHIERKEVCISERNDMDDQLY